MTELSLTLITGRSTKQGTGISAGKQSPEYQEAINVVGLCKSDMALLGLSDGDPVRLTTEFGTADVKCRRADISEGLAFMAYGPACNRLVGNETYASGMPDSKQVEVVLSRSPFSVAPAGEQGTETGNADPRTGHKAIQVDHVICAFCGCDCDDIRVTVEGDRITHAGNACVLGKAWFLSHGSPSDQPVARIEGKAVPLEQGIEEAARHLAAARYPFIYGLSSTSCEAQRKAVALAEVLGGCIDCCTSVCHGPSGMALQGVGEPTCTLGEVKNRADLIIYWGSNPAESHPRHATRYAVMPKGMFVPEGRKGRTVVLVDVRRTPSSRLADIYLQINPGRDFEALWALQGLVNGQKLDTSAVAGIGLTLEQLTDLADRMMRCRFGVLFVGQGLTQTRGRHFNSSAAFLLVRALHRHTRFALIPMRGHGNVTGIDNVLGWQTGFPFGVNFSLGYPRFNPGEYTVVDALTRGEADAALIIASDPYGTLPAKAARRLAEIPTISLDTHESETTRIARVAFTTATAGIHVEGTVYRMDNVPIRLRKVLSSRYPSDEEVIGRLLARVKELKAC